MTSGLLCMTAAGAAHIGSVVTQEIPYYAQECISKAILRDSQCSIIRKIMFGVSKHYFARHPQTTWHNNWIAATF